MTVGTTQALLVELVLIALMAIFSAAEAALRASLRTTTRRTLAAVILTDFFITFALAAVAAAYLAPGLGELLQFFGFEGIVPSLTAVVVTVAVVSVLAIQFGVFLPRSIAARHPARVRALLAAPIRVVSVAFAPIVGVLFGATSVLARPFGANPEASALVTEEELKALVETGEEQGVLEQEEREMIHSILSFGEKVAHEVMVPRTDIVGLDAQTTLREALDVVTRSGLSRLPVYHGSPDDIVGILYVKDLFRHIAKGRSEVPLTDLVRPAHFIPETKKVAELLREMQVQKVHLAIVVDEYGGTAGLVTIEDLVEEIVGEIRDEFEAAEERIVPVSDHEALMDARVPFEDVNELFELEREPSEDYDTLGGFIAHELGRVPRQGDVVRSRDVTFAVESTEGRSARKVRVRREVAAPARQAT